MKNVYLINENSLSMALCECLDIEKRQVVTVDYGDNSRLYLDDLSYGMLIELVKSLYSETDPDSSYETSNAGCTLEEYQRNYMFIALMKAFDDFIFDEEIDLVGQMMKEAYKELYEKSLSETDNYTLAMDSIKELVETEKIAKYTLVKEPNGYRLELRGKSIDDWDF